jgi:molybdopterin-biosynthesis enzyme MoeA-like protein
VYVRSDGAIAFARPLAYHAPTLAKMEAFFRGRGQPVTDAAKRMALFPADSAVVEVPRLWVPLVVCENVYVLPGVPQLFTAMVQALPGRLGHHGTIHRILLYTPDVEGPPTRSSLSLSCCVCAFLSSTLSVGPHAWCAAWLVNIASGLERAARAYASVSIGSYPRFGDVRCPVMVSLEGRNEADVRACAARLQTELRTYPSVEACYAAAAATAPGGPSRL